ncbi:MAG: AmmeMemoRadiSam system protein A [Oscillospiraceae bacterium]|jgi:AmmeMemoRadiSam system protein A/AmmeMemoRadiSam system protein B|nr:AmmeMemoRadiSam system protein A [Oscillospiraceae bacterium]
MLKAYLVPHPPLLVEGIGNSDALESRSALGEIASEIERDNPDTLIIISPHSIMYDDYIHIAPGKSASGDFANFGAGHIKFNVDYDDELVAEVAKIAEFEEFPAGTLGEKKPALDHGVMVPLAFLGTKRKIVRVSLSGLSVIDHYFLGMIITKAAAELNRKIAVIASGDMSHKLKADGPYGLVPEGSEFDEFMQKCVKNTDFIKLCSVSNELREKAAECGYMSLVILAGALDGMNVKSRLLCYEAPFGVGYLTAAFEADGETESLLPLLAEARLKEIETRRENESIYVRLARANVESFVTDGKQFPLELFKGQNSLSEEMLTKRAGVFVSLKIDGNLRGCIGTISPVTENIAQEILRNSVSAAAEDPRFPPVRAHELDSITYSVDVLGAPEAIESADELDVVKYGVIVTCGHKRGLLLPNLDGVDTIEKQVSIALQKAGINKNEPYSLERFEVIRHI